MTAPMSNPRATDLAIGRTPSPDMPTSDLYGPIRADLDQVIRRFDEEIHSDVPYVLELCERIRSYRGKMLRPALVLLTGKACGGTGEYESRAGR